MADTSARAYKKGFRTEWKNFAWCFVAAAVLWLFTVLNEDYSSSIIVSAKYVNYPASKVFLKPLPDEFKVMVTAKGWDLMSNYFRRKAQSITIDLNDYKKTDELVSRTLQDKFGSLMSQKITIGEVFPETVSLIKDDKGSKKVPVHLVNNLSYRDQYGLGGDISYAPDSVIVTGPESVVKTITHVDTDVETLANLNKPTSDIVTLKEPDPKNIAYSPDKVTVQIPVYQLTEKSINIPVQVINQSMIDTLKLIPQSISVVYQVPINKYSQLDLAQFQAIVDGSQIDTTNREPLKIQLITQPKYAYNVRLNPDNVDYVIRK